MDVKKKAVMVAATGQHHGKTTVTLGMVNMLLERGLKVGYQKPVGQQTVPVMDGALGELQIDRDVDIFKHVWPQLHGSFTDASPVAFPPGFTRMVLDKKVDTRDLEKRCVDSFQRMVTEVDYLVVEGTGHIGVGAIIDLNNAQVAAALGLDVVIVAPGGLGVSFDVLATNYSMLKEHGVKLKGVVLNKVNPAKREMNVNYYRKALERWGVPLMGVIPEEASLPLLSMKAFHKILPQAEWVSCPEKELRFFHHTRLLVTPEDEEDNSPIKHESLMIMHSSRTVTLEAVLRQHREYRMQRAGDLLGGVIVVGPDRPSAEHVRQLGEEGIPALFVKKGNFDGTGFDLIERVLGHTHKHHRADLARIHRTCEHVSAHIDLDAIIG